ncbi:AAA family ATPase [Mycobacterium sp. M1]|uniref:AAA family ATPase n=1 Tax=Mycolicibacter acidiphilus TaxID=2835306 RepID=A0ABS5RDM0_9MYCO|nr:AAA family ATPase [Mycolicibacter acidiphilus]MBS9532382.1 AAA family ATPase [Mycolicibacter acidiphilus]
MTVINGEAGAFEAWLSDGKKRTAKPKNGAAKAAGGGVSEWLIGAKAHPQSAHTGIPITVIEGAEEHPFFVSALERVCEDLAAMTPGQGRNPALNRASWYLGRFPVDREVIRDALLQACHVNGLVATYGIQDCERTISNGFRGADEAGLLEIAGGWTGVREMTADEVAEIIRGHRDAAVTVDDGGVDAEPVVTEFTTGGLPPIDEFDPGEGSAESSTSGDDRTEHQILDAMMRLHVAAEAKKRYADLVAETEMTDADLWGDLPPAAGDTFLFDDATDSPILWGRGDEICWSGGEALMIVGPSGLGKTTLAGMVLRAQLGLADEVLGLPVPTTDGKILYLAMDRPRQIRKSLLRQLSIADRAVVAAKLVVRTGPPLADILTRPSLLTEMAESVGAATIYVDSLKDIAIGLSEDAVGAAYNRARQHALAHGVDILELHHTVKRNANGGAPKELADVYGSNWLTAGAGTVIVLSGKAGDPLIDFSLLKQAEGDVGPWRLEVDHTAGSIRRVEGVDPVELALYDPDGVTAADYAVELFGIDTVSRGQIEKARRKLEKLADDGLMTRIDGTRGGSGGSRTPTRYRATGRVREVSDIPGGGSFAGADSDPWENPYG